MKKTIIGLNFRFCTILALPILLLPLLFLGEDNDKRFKCVYGVTLTTAYAILNAFPLQVSFLLPVFLFPVLGLMDTSAVVANYMKETAMIIFGMVTIGLALERSNLQNRFIYRILLLTGSSPMVIFSGVLIGSAFLAMWLDNTFIVTVMTPIAIAICDELDREVQVSVETEIVLDTESPECSVHFGSEMSEKNSQVNIKDDKKNVQKTQTVQIKKALLIAITSAVSVGCKGTLYGSNITITYMQMLQSQGSFDKSELNFLTWMAYNIPVIIVSLFIVWSVLVFSFFGNPFTYNKRFNFKESSVVSPSESNQMTNVKKILRKRLKELGPVNSQEIGALLFLVFAFLLWFTRDPKIFPGWGRYFGSTKIGDATPAILVAFLLLILPYRWPSSSQSYDTFINWKYLEKRFPWGVLFMLGGGFAISDAIVKSELNLWIEEQLSFLDNLPKEAILIILLVVATSATEFLNGLACFLILLPIISSLSWRLELHPLYLGLPISVVCTYGFMLPSGQSYMALMLTMAEGDLKIMDIFKAGVWLNIGCVLVIYVMNMTWGEYLFSYSEYSNGVNATTVPSNI